MDDLALHPAFIGLPNWRVIQWLKIPWMIFKWYLTFPFPWAWVNFFFWWCVVSVIFAIWWSWARIEMYNRYGDDDK